MAQDQGHHQQIGRIGRQVGGGVVGLDVGVEVGVEVGDPGDVDVAVDVGLPGFVEVGVVVCVGEDVRVEEGVDLLVVEVGVALRVPVALCVEEGATVEVVRTGWLVEPPLAADDGTTTATEVGALVDTGSDRDAEEVPEDERAAADR